MTRIEPALEPAFVREPEGSTLPGWVAAVIYLLCTAVLSYTIWDRLL